MAGKDGIDGDHENNDHYRDGDRWHTCCLPA
jgi:hypothetical protein